MARDLPLASRQFVEQYCVECHDADTRKGGLDLTELKFDPANSTNFSTWVLVHDRVSNGQMPPKKKARPDSADAEAFIKSLASSLTEAEEAELDQMEHINHLMTLLKAEARKFLAPQRKS